MKLVYMESNVQAAVIKFLLIDSTVYWSVCNQHKEIGCLLGDMFCLEQLQGAGMTDNLGQVLHWDSFGFDVETPYEFRSEIQGLFFHLQDEIYQRWKEHS